MVCLKFKKLKRKKINWYYDMDVMFDIREKNGKL